MAGGPADAMTKTFLFDLDMTLVDTSALATLRKTQQWHLVAANMHLVRAFRALPGGVAPHEMPAALSMAGHRVGIVTSSPRPYAEEITRLFRIPYDVLATMYRHLGIDPHHTFSDLSGRPLPLLNEGEVISELV